MEFKKNAFVRKALPWVLAAAITAAIAYGSKIYYDDFNKRMGKSVGELSHGLYSGGDSNRN